MQSWQIKALKLEVSALDDLNRFVRENALYFLVAIICLLVVLLAWVLSGGLRQRFKQLPGTVHPVIVIQSPAPPPPEPEPFPPYWEPSHCDCDRDDDYPD